MEVAEYNIPVLWGHISVKAWGNKNDPPVLAVHGLQDNAGIFDRIMPLLPQCFYYMCIDLPSHGRSSPFPTQMFISPMDGVLMCKLILDYLDRKEYILLGHSWGAHALVMFTQLYPKYVLKLCLLDGFFPYPAHVEMYKGYWHTRIDGLIKINESITKSAQPTYTYEEAMDKLIEKRMLGGITKPTAECLLKRCLTVAENGKFAFTTDPRLRVFLIADCDLNYMSEVTKTYPIICPLLLLKASMSWEGIWSHFQPLLSEVEKLPKCEIVELRGNHNDFSNEPEPWAAIISEFLSRKNSKL